MTRPLIRHAVAQDRAAFLDLWAEFMATDPDEPGDRAMGPVNWDRVMAGEMSLLVADVDGDVAGFTLYSEMPFTWSRKPVCYLQDIHVTQAARGARIGQRMIEALADIGREKGWFRIFWMTQPHNASAQRLYDRVAERKDYLRYDLVLSEA